MAQFRSARSLEPLANLLWGLVKVGVQPSPLWMRNFQTAALETAMQANEDAVAGTSDGSSSSSSRRPGRSKRKAAGRGRGYTSSSSRDLPKHVAVLLSAFAEARQQPTPALASLLLDAAAAGGLEQQDTKVLVELLVSLGELQLVPDSAWLGSYCRASISRLGQYSGWQLANSVFAFGKLQRALEGLAVVGGQKGFRGVGGTWASQSATFAALVEQSLHQQQQQQPTQSKSQEKQEQQQQEQQQAERSSGKSSSSSSSSSGSCTPSIWALQLDVQQWVGTALSCLPRELPHMAARDLADLLFGLALLQWPVGASQQQLMSALPLPAAAAAGGGPMGAAAVAAAAGDGDGGKGLAGSQQQLVDQLLQEVREKLRRFNAAALAIVLDSLVALQQQELDRQQQQREGIQEELQQQQQASFLTDAWLEAYLSEVQQKLPVIGAEDMRRMLRALAAAGAAVPADWVTAAAGHLQGKLTLLSLQGLVDVQVAVMGLGFSPSQAWLRSFMAAVRGALEGGMKVTEPVLLLQLLRGLEQWGAQPGEVWVNAVRGSLGQFWKDWMLQQELNQVAGCSLLMEEQRSWGRGAGLFEGQSSGGIVGTSQECMDVLLAGCEQVLAGWEGSRGLDPSGEHLSRSGAMLLVS